VFDNFAWFTKFGDPDFIYEQQMARVFGIEMLHMAQTDVLPYDYALYGHEIESYLVKASLAAEHSRNQADFTGIMISARRFTAAGEAIANLQKGTLSDDATAKLNKALRDAERAFLLPEGLPKRPWFKHAVFAPGEYTGYAAVVVPGVNEAIDARDQERTQQQIAALRAALDRAAKVLDDCYKSLKM
jgi:N-acetylated-alpha-linked acidic dipeptidase